MKNLPEENYNDGYYHVAKDLEKFPGYWLYVVWSRRGPGKTYSLLYYCLKNNIKFIYLKRTKEDVNFLCMPVEDPATDPNPFAPINRDHGTNIKIRKIKEGMAEFVEEDSEGDPVGAPVGMIYSFSVVSKLKGFNADAIKIICFDEFIPQPTEIIRKGSGKALLSLYMTVSRDREKRGFEPLKMVLFANAEEISTPETNLLEITDDMAELNISGKPYKDLKKRKIMLHHITEEEIPLTEDEKGAIFQGMAGTAWHEYAFGGYFANNDFSNVKKIDLKGFSCYIHLIHNRKDIYIYFNKNNGRYHFSSSKNKCIFTYDLSKENDQRLFYVKHSMQLQEALMLSRITFEKYTMYDLLKNYTKFYKL